MDWIPRFYSTQFESEPDLAGFKRRAAAVLKSTWRFHLSLAQQ